jgi:hypothetical protein
MSGRLFFCIGGKAWGARTVVNRRFHSEPPVVSVNGILRQSDQATSRGSLRFVTDPGMIMPSVVSRSPRLSGRFLTLTVLFSLIHGVAFYISFAIAFSRGMYRFDHPEVRETSLSVQNSGHPGLPSLLFGYRPQHNRRV